MKIGCLLAFSGVFTFSIAQKQREFDQFVKAFNGEFVQLGIPEMVYDYVDYFGSVPDSSHISRQQHFFLQQTKQLSTFQREKLSGKRKVQYDHIRYELDFNLFRTKLELEWLRAGRIVPTGGISDLKNNREWYGYFVRKFTSLNTSPEDIIAYGTSEVKRINHELDSISRLLGYSDKNAFRTFLNDSVQYYYETAAIKHAFARTDSTIRSHLPAFLGNVSIPPVIPVEWPNANAYTPPGIYLNQTDNLYGADVFMYNFYGGQFSKRAIEWLYLHEAIPGHHLQASLRRQRQSFLEESVFTYPGNFEGWACYVEDCGKELGMYKDPVSYFGKCEWDLVRSARLVLDAGIHCEGWSSEQALEYWKSSVEGLDHLADREIQRVTNWPGQALSYKLGARFIREQFASCATREGNQFDQIRFYTTFLSFGMLPLPVIATHFEEAYLHDKL